MQWPPTPGPGRNGMNPNGLVAGVDDLGDVEREVTGNICHLVGEGDVDGTKRVLEELGELGRLG